MQRLPFIMLVGMDAPPVRELLKDSRVKVNEPQKDGYTSLWSAAADGHLDVIKWWIASGREMDLGKPGDRMPLRWQAEWQDRGGDPAGDSKMMLPRQGVMSGRNWNQWSELLPLLLHPVPIPRPFSFSVHDIFHFLLHFPFGCER